MDLSSNAKCSLRSFLCQLTKSALPRTTFILIRPQMALVFEINLDTTVTARNCGFLWANKFQRLLFFFVFFSSMLVFEVLTFAISLTVHWSKIRSVCALWSNRHGSLVDWHNAVGPVKTFCTLTDMTCSAPHQLWFQLMGDFSDGSLFVLNGGEKPTACHINPSSCQHYRLLVLMLCVL